MSLTDEQIIEIAKATRTVEWGWQGGYILPIEFARAIERELALKWTDEAPTVPGKYWWREGELDENPEIVLVGPFKDEQGRLWHVSMFHDMEDVVQSMGGQWAGPIPSPTVIARPRQ